MDVTRIKQLALVEPETLRGRLRSWYNKRHELGQMAAADFEDQTTGGLLRDYFRDAAQELSRLRGQLRADGHDPDIEARAAELERLFSDSDQDLQALDADESLENWYVPRTTGDPVADKWERQIAQGDEPDLDA